MVRFNVFAYGPVAQLVERIIRTVSLVVFGLVVQLVEHRIRIAEVEGSSPSQSTKNEVGLMVASTTSFHGRQSGR